MPRPDRRAEPGWRGQSRTTRFERPRVPHLARLARLLGDEHDLEPAPFGGRGDAPEPLAASSAVADQRDDAVDLVEQDA